jgi:hypothetical protein
MGPITPAGCCSLLRKSMVAPATSHARPPSWIADTIRLLAGLPAGPGPIRLAPRMIEIAGVIGDRAVMETEAVLRTSVATLTLLMLLPAAAQPLRPAVKQAQCPLGYMQSGGYCMPMGRNPPSAVPKRPPVASPLSRFLLPRGTWHPGDRRQSERRPSSVA